MKIIFCNWNWGPIIPHWITSKQHRSLQPLFSPIRYQLLASKSIHFPGVLQQCSGTSSGTSQGLQSSQGEEACDNSYATKTRISEELRDRNPHWSSGTRTDLFTDFKALKASFPQGLYGLLPHSQPRCSGLAQTMWETKTIILLRYKKCFLSELYPMHPSISQWLNTVCRTALIPFLWMLAAFTTLEVPP